LTGISIIILLQKPVYYGVGVLVLPDVAFHSIDILLDATLITILHMVFECSLLVLLHRFHE
jgi:hypothetical protein